MGQWESSSIFGYQSIVLEKFLKYSKLDPDEFTEEYIGFHNELLSRAGGLEKDRIKPIYAPARNDVPSPETFIREDKKIERNDPCPCGSGKKYKKCCLGKSLNFNGHQKVLAVYRPHLFFLVFFLRCGLFFGFLKMLCHLSG